MCWLAATMSLNVSATFPARPVHVPGSRTVKSPSRMVCRHVKMTFKSRDELSPFDLPLFFPLLFATGRTLSAASGATALARLIYSSLEKGRLADSFRCTDRVELTLALILRCCFTRDEFQCVNVSNRLDSPFQGRHRIHARARMTEKRTMAPILYDIKIGNTALRPHALRFFL